MLDQIRQSFKQPDAIFSPMPFWFWNDRLDKKELRRQIEAFKEKGVDGFVIHPRIGLTEDIPYLSDVFMSYVEYAVACAKELEMKVILYDEAMYPSGSAHGQVVASNPNFASKGLKRIEGPLGKLEESETLIATIDVNEQTGERILASDAIPPNFKRYYFILTPSEGTIRGVHYGEDDGEAKAPKSADLLNIEATKTFIQLTHERYYEVLQPYFGETIIAMFTDEPMILGRCEKSGLIEWTDDFLEEYLEMGGEVTDLPCLFDSNEKASKIYKHYQSVVKNRLGETFYAPIANWCQAHHIQLTGHPESSEDIGLLKYFDIPCQDIVWRYVEPMSDKGTVGGHSTMAKCSSDSARHRGKLRNGNECFGCCSSEENPYLFTREDMKWYLDWLFVRGVNMIYPHAFFYSMRDDRKDERPPDVGMNSCFWEEYKEISDYIKRMCQLLAGSYNLARVAIVCTRDHLPWQAAKFLYENQIEFNYLEEELLEACNIADGKVCIAQQQYSLLITTGQYEEQTKAQLTTFEQAGVQVLHITEQDEVIDLRREMAQQRVTFSPGSSDLRSTHLCKEGSEFVLLTNEGEEEIVTTMQCIDYQIIEVWDAETGETQRLEASKVQLKVSLNRRKSLIVVLKRENIR